MKKITFLLFFASLVVCGQQRELQAPEIKTSSIEKSLNYLASDKLKGREIGSKGIEKAAQYIENSFEKAGVKPYYETYRDSFAYKDQTGYNLIAYKEGSDPDLKDEIVMLGAHYDHIGVLDPVQGDSIANGGNDNAAGTTAILELAKYFSHKDTKRSLLFVLFSGEEKGLIGSTHLAKRMKKEGTPLYVMLNFEMVGVPLRNRDYTAYLTGYHQSNLAEKFNAYANKSVFGFFEKAKAFNLFKRSDNYPFYKQLGIPAQTLCTFDFSNYGYYHKVGDEVHRLDIPFMKQLILECIPGIEGVVNSPEGTIRIKE